MTQKIADRLLDPIQTEVFTTDTLIILFSGAIQDPRSDLEKHSIFMFPKQKKSNETAPEPPKMTENKPSNHQKAIAVKMLFLQSFPYENLVIRPPTVNKPIQKTMQKETWKQTQQKHRIQPSETKKLSKWIP